MKDYFRTNCPKVEKIGEKGMVHLYTADDYAKEYKMAAGIGTGLFAALILVRAFFSVATGGGIIYNLFEIIIAVILSAGLWLFYLNQKQVLEDTFTNGALIEGNLVCKEIGSQRQNIYRFHTDNGEFGFAKTFHDKQDHQDKFQYRSRLCSNPNCPPMVWRAKCYRYSLGGGGKIKFIVKERILIQN